MFQLSAGRTIPAEIVGNDRVTAIRFRPGVDAGVRLEHTADILGQVARQGAGDPRVRQAAMRISNRFQPTPQLAQAYQNTGGAYRNMKYGPALRQRALDIQRRARIPEHDQEKEIMAIGKWVAKNIRYTADPWKVEMFQHPARTLDPRNMAGDCDDMVATASALASSIGYPTAALIVNAGGGGYNHVMWGVRPYTKPSGYTPIELTKGPGKLNAGSLGSATKYIIVEVA